MITRYEITARHPDGRTFLIGYTPRVSRPGLRAAMQKHGSTIVLRLPVLPDDQMTFATLPRIHAKCSGWTIGFTGRTEVQSRQEGEHEFIAAEPQGRERRAS